MTIASIRKRVGFDPLQQWVPEEFEPELQATLEDQSAGLAQSIRDATVTAEQIDFFLQHRFELVPPKKGQDLRQRLLAFQARLLFSQGREEEGLELYDQALSVKETPSTWASKGMALLQLERLDEAFDAFRHSYSLRGEFGAKKQAHLENLLGVWSVGALLRGLSGILDQDVREAEKGVLEYIQLLNQAKQEHLEHAVLNLAVEKPVTRKMRAALEELELMVRLLSIKDPFDGWRALTKEISKVWPPGLSAVDAIREQRK